MDSVESTRSKRDPAWEHCQIFKDGGKVELKCIYCEKVFKGGGIFRIKEHLAGQKGNGVTCSKVQPDIRRQMLDSLNGSSGKKRKMDELRKCSYNNPESSCVDVPINHSGSNAEFDLFSVNEILEHGSNGDTYKQDEVSNKSGSRKLKERFRKKSNAFESGAIVLAREPIAGNRPKRDPAWKHCEVLKNGNKVQLKCIYCQKIFKGGGIYRLKEHLAGKKGNGVTCLKVQPDVRLQMFESLNSGEKTEKEKLFEEKTSYDNPGTSGILVPSNRNDLNVEFDMLAIALTSSQATNSKKVNSEVPMAIGRFFFDVGLPMEAVNSAYFQPMIDAIASQGLGAMGPSYHDLRSWVLKNSVEEMRSHVDLCRRDWGRSGCSILVNEWGSLEGKTFVNFLVNSPQGTVFLRSADISNANDSPNFLHELMRETVEEVGAINVLQVITRNEHRYAIAGKRLMETYPNVFWTPCAGHSIDLMLEDIGELSWVKTIVDQAKLISRYIYSNNVVFNMMRRFTFGVDLVDLGITRSSSDFMTLKQIVNMSRNLQLMFTSEEWMESPYSKTLDRLAILDCISNQSFWSMCALITRLTDPLLRLLRIVCSEKRPAMGYVYAGIYRAKETIKKELISKKEYSHYWNIIDNRWEQLQWHPLHAAGFYFNPKFFYSLQGDALYQSRSLVNDCMEKLVPEPQIQDRILKETISYHGGVGDFGRKMATRARDTLLPTEWWLTFGGGCPNLTRLAIRILSQTCSLIQHNKLNKVPLELTHEWKNSLEHQRLSDLVFVQCNLSLKQMVLGDKKQENVDPIAYENIDIVGDWVAEKKVDQDGLRTVDWMGIDPPLGTVMPLDPSPVDIEALGAGFDDYEILNGVKQGDEENGNYS